MRKLCTKFYIWLMSFPVLLTSVFGLVFPAHAAAIDIQIDGTYIAVGDEIVSQLTDADED